MFKKRLSALFFGILLSFSFVQLNAAGVDNDPPECMVCWNEQADDDAGQRIYLAYISEQNQCEHHFICRPCAAEYIRENRARFVNNNPIECPAQDCNRALDEGDLIQLMGGPLYGEMVEARDQQIAALQGRVLTQTEIDFMNGPEVLGGDENNPRVDGHQVCRARLCPNCHVLTERDGHCNHMRCDCGTEYCYNCLRDWGDRNDPELCDRYYNCPNPVRQDRLPVAGQRNINPIPDPAPAPAPVVIPGPNPNQSPVLANVPGRRINRLGRNNNNPPRMVVSNGNHTVRNSIIVAAVIATTTLVFVKWQWIKQKATKFKNWVGSKFSRNKKIANKNNMQQNNAVKTSA